MLQNEYVPYAGRQAPGHKQQSFLKAGFQGDIYTKPFPNKILSLKLPAYFTDRQRGFF